MDQILKSSWGRLRELLETADCLRHSYLASSAACVMKTSDDHLLERTVFFKKKHRYTKHATLITRLGVIDKDMKAHSLAVYKAWEAMAVLNAEYLAILAVQKEKADDKAEREEENKERIDDLEDAAARARKRVHKKLARRLNKDIDLGGSAEDAADALEDVEDEAKEQQQETKKIEEEKKIALRTHVLTSYPLDEANQLLALSQHISVQEFESYLRNFTSKKSAPPVKIPPQSPPKSVLNLLDNDSYDEPISRKKNKTRDLSSSSSESESDVSVILPDSPRKEQRLNDLADSMSSIQLANSGSPQAA